MFREQPRAFYMIFLIEIWERFGYYTVQGILALFFIRNLGFSDEEAYFAFGAFSALVYGMVAIGGYLGDKVLGTRRTMLVGLITLACGYLALAFADIRQVFFALGLIAVGNGLFKANPANLLARCYTPNDPRLHGGFTLYYMAVNLGSVFALFVGPALSARYGYMAAYFASFLGLMLGLVNYVFQRHTIDQVVTDIDRKPLPLWGWCLLLAGIVGATVVSSWLLQHVFLTRNLLWMITALVVAVYGYFVLQEPADSARRMVVAVVLMVEAVVFFVLYQQMPTSLNLFAVNNVTPTLFGVTIDPQSFQVLNPIWIILLSPLLAQWYARMHRRGGGLDMPHKFALGMTLCGISFLLLYFARFVHDEAGQVSSWWLVASYFFQSSGELLVSALGVAMVAELVPASITGFVMGMWFLTSAVAGFLGASVASRAALPMTLNPGVESLEVYTRVFAEIGLVTLAIAMLLWALAPVLGRYANKKSFS